MKDSGWRFDTIKSRTIYFYKTTEMDGSYYVKLPVKGLANLTLENVDKHCFLWSILAHLHPSINSHPDRVSNSRQIFEELNLDGFDFSNGVK